jgi:hypothetical protein
MARISVLLFLSDVLRFGRAGRVASHLVSI